MKIEQFYKHSQSEIVSMFRDFIEDDMFVLYPKLIGKISLIITGSIPSGHYDEYSDIDCEFFYENSEDREQMNQITKEYKKSLLDRQLPIQFHPSKTFNELQNEHLHGFEHDDALREYSKALIVIDPENRFKKLQSLIEWYPKNVLTEKINWLFAEAVFNFEERYTIAVKRQNSLYAHSVCSNIIKLLSNAILMSKKHWPVFEKHLYTELKEYRETDFCSQVDEIFALTNLNEIETSLRKILKNTEERLLKQGQIDNRSTGEWILLRPKYQVEHCG